MCFLLVSDKRFHTLPLPKKNKYKDKKKTPSKDDSEGVTRKKSFVDMTRRKFNRAKEQVVIEPLQRKAGVEKASILHCTFTIPAKMLWPPISSVT